MNNLKKYWPLFIIASIVFYLAIINYRPGTILSGGDNLHPEFNFLLNIKRSLFAVWQEYEGLGALGAMGHASDLVRQLILWGMSFLIPTDLIRYAWTMLTLFLGSTGAYFLIRKILCHSRLDRESDPHVHEDDNYQIAMHPSVAHNEKIEKPFAIPYSLFALLGALFYLLNLGTIQQYYTPFEVFSSQFAILPWLFLTTINYFQKHSRKHLVLLALTLLLATPQGYVPTIFVVWALATGILLLPLLLNVKKTTMQIHHQKSLLSTKISHLFEKINNRIKLKQLMIFSLLVFTINAFWLLPFVYFTLTNVNVDVNAKINQMASENIYLMNKEYGNLTDTMLLRGFWFQNVEPAIDGTLQYMFLPWREHFAQPFIQFLGYGFFALILFGVLASIVKKQRLLLGFVGIFLFSVVMLTTNTPPFEQINTFLRMVIPLFKEVFRFPFTKFSVLAGLSYAVFLSYGLFVLLTFLQKKQKRYHRIIRFGGIGLTLLILGILAFPALRGDLFYTRERSQQPAAYKELFAYMQTQDPSKRVAVFPHHTFWDWKFYSWGYSGSGFLWYGMPQPVLDRTFDMWEMQNENYYHEMSQALYSQNAKQIRTILQKYQISYLLVDKNVTYTPAPQALFFPELENLLAIIPEVKKEKTFDNIMLYSVDLRDKPQSFVSLHSELPRINQYEWVSNDYAYTDYGPYIADTNPSILYPFRTLFTLKTQENRDFTMRETRSSIEFASEIPQRDQAMQLTVPSLRKTMTTLPAFIKTTKLPDSSIRFDLEIKTPEIWLGTQKISGNIFTKNLQTVKQNQISDSLLLNINGVSVPYLLSQNTNQSFLLSLTEDNILVLTDKAKKRTATFVIEPESLLSEPFAAEKTITLPKSTQTEVFKVSIPKTDDRRYNFTAAIEKSEEVKNCDVFRTGNTNSILSTNNGLGQLQVQAANATACIGFFADSLPHDQGYAMFVTAEHKKGKGFHFWVANEDEKFTPIDTYLPANNKKSVSSFILPPQDPYGSSYSFHFDSISIGDENTDNILHNFTIYQMPYTFLTQLAFAKNETFPKNAISPYTVSHPNESLYDIRLQGSPYKQTLMLAQAFNTGWRAYSIPENLDTVRSFLVPLVPFMIGEEVVPQRKINNWANGWEITDNQKHLVIVYLPQYLEYLGFLLLLGTGISFLSYLKKH